MKKVLLLVTLCCTLFHFSFAQHYGDFPKIKKDLLLNDLELLHQGLDKLHAGMYWYTPKDSVDNAFEKVKKEINDDLNILEYYKLIAPLVALSNEGHTGISLPENAIDKLSAEAKFMPLTVVFIGNSLHCVKNGSEFNLFPLEGKEIESINGETPESIVNKIGSLISSDGYITTVKYKDLTWFKFASYYYMYYGEVEQFNIQFKGIEKPVSIKSLLHKDINNNLKRRYENTKSDREPLEYKTLGNATAYLGIHSFSNATISEKSKEKNLTTFLKNSFQSIEENNIKTLIIDVSRNDGGDEENANLLYSYLGENYQKYKTVKANTHKATLNNGVDAPIEFKVFGFLEKVFANQKMVDGSFERKKNIGHGLMAYKREAKHPFRGKVYIITSPYTYSAASNFCSMMYSNNLATFVGEETGGGYYGNTSGYIKSLILPNSKIEVHIPVLQFVMNVKAKLPFGSGIIPHHKIVPTFEQRINGENHSLNYILKTL